MPDLMGSGDVLMSNSSLLHSGGLVTSSTSYWRKANARQYIGWRRGTVSGKTEHDKFSSSSPEDTIREMEETRAAQKIARDFMERIMAKEKAPMVREAMRRRRIVEPL